MHKVYAQISEWKNERVREKEGKSIHELKIESYKLQIAKVTLILREYHEFLLFLVEFRPSFRSSEAIE